jgi:hypothetical protein
LDTDVLLAAGAWLDDWWELRLEAKIPTPMTTPTKIKHAKTFAFT